MNLAKKKGNLNIIHVDLDNIYRSYPDMTLYFYRIFMAFYFLQAHPEIEKAVLTDAGDVTHVELPLTILKTTLYMGTKQPSSYFYSWLVIIDENPQYIKILFLKTLILCQLLTLV